MNAFVLVIALSINGQFGVMNPVLLSPSTDQAACQVMADNINKSDKLVDLVSESYGQKVDTAHVFCRELEAIER